MITNPYAPEHADTETSTFVAEVARHIASTGQQKKVLFFGDTNHFAPRIHGLFFSRPVFESLNHAGITDVFVERPIYHQPLVDAVTEGKLTPEQFHQLLSARIVQKDHISPQTRMLQNIVLGQAIVYAAQLGIHIHAADPSAGFVREKDMKPYNFFKTEETRGWLKFVLRDPRIFNDPDRLINEIVRDYSEKYSKRGIDLEYGLRQDSLTPIQAIYQFWLLEHRSKLPDSDKFLRKSLVGKQIGLSTLDERRKYDSTLSAQFQKHAQERKIAVFYGFAHFRNESGGMVKHLQDSDYAVIQLMNHDEQGIPKDFHELYCTHMHPTDSIVLLHQKRIATAGEVLGNLNATEALHTNNPASQLQHNI